MSCIPVQTCYGWKSIKVSLIDSNVCVNRLQCLPPSVTLSRCQGSVLHLDFFSFRKSCFLKRHLQGKQGGQGRVEREGWKESTSWGEILNKFCKHDGFLIVLFDLFWSLLFDCPLRSKVDHEPSPFLIFSSLFLLESLFLSVIQLSPSSNVVPLTVKEQTLKELTEGGGRGSVSLIKFVARHTHAAHTHTAHTHGTPVTQK